MTVFVTTAYLDEAERCNRVGLMSGGKMIRCEAPRTLREGMPEAFFQVVGPRLRELRTLLQGQAGVVSAEPSGAALHVFVERGEAERRVMEVARGAGFGEEMFQAAVPSLEDVFIALVAKDSREVALHG